MLPLPRAAARLRSGQLWLRIRLLLQCSGMAVGFASRFSRQIPGSYRAISTATPAMEFAHDELPANNLERLPISDPADKVDLRVGVINSVTKHPEADKLLLLSVDVGEGAQSTAAERRYRTIVSGLADYYSPEQLTGKMIVLFANLKPRKLRGIESQGMLLAASSVGSNGDAVRVEVLEAPADSQPGNRVVVSSVQKLLSAGQRLGEKPPVVSQRAAKTFIDGLALDSGMATLKHERLVTESGGSISTANILAGMVG